MEILRDVSIDWMGKKWYLIGVSIAALAIGAIAYAVNGGLAYGIDFTGGTIIYLKFNQAPDVDQIRQSLSAEAVGTTVIQRFGDPEENSVIVRMQSTLESEGGVDAGHRKVRSLLAAAFDPQSVGRAEPDFNSVGLDALTLYLQEKDPEGLRSQNKTVQEVDDRCKEVAQALLDYRDKVAGGLLSSLDDLARAGNVTPQAVESVRKGFYTAPFAVKGVESVGAIVGSDLRRRATLAIGLSLLGMLVYIAFRFKPVFGVAAVLPVFHDVLVTLGLFALTQKEISLSVIAALLTLVGYSVNDTIVIFDRVRENLRLHHKESLTRILNLSINQTLSRTILTSGFTFLAVVSMFLFGGEVLNGFSFALTVGIIVGSYSTLAIASPLVDAWYRWTGNGAKRKAA